MDVFVTGGTGSIGAAVVKKLLQEDGRVIGLARSDTASEKLRALGASAFPGDLRNPDSWVERAASCDAVVHMGATFSEDMGRIDRRSMLGLKQAAKHRKQPLKVVYTGGIWLYPSSRNGQLITEKTPFAPLPAFRFMAETIRTLSHGTDMNLTVVHPALVCSREIGPIAAMTKALQSEQPFETRATPDTVWPLVETNDLASLYLLALKQARFRLTLIASSIPGISVGHLASHISARHGKLLDVVSVAAPSDTNPDTDWSAGYTLSQTVDTSHAQRVTGWRPELSAIEDLVVTLSR
ncbi:MAG: NAD-dependent epimerase/dehydratase family protein [Roseibium sp.]|uniref:NAD-dependent epimerase/dehydratase family protein n=1 Tax=Roseibium sp. TaxID=1936156 RepID=UPI0026129163|nr:NAD-dependent epimerase/dehydratase family protein [Roseibium sp.]MCV0426430.1 NAD-dependent epimerase/dehydratase family protein [Roseibium sp.]